MGCFMCKTHPSPPVSLGNLACCECLKIVGSQWGQQTHFFKKVSPLSYLWPKSWVPKSKISPKHIHECSVLSSVFALEYLFLCQPHTAQFSGYLQPAMSQYIDTTPTLQEIVEHKGLLFAIPSPSTCLLTKMCVTQHATQIWKTALLCRVYNPRGGHRKEETVETQRTECK